MILLELSSASQFVFWAFCCTCRSLLGLGVCGYQAAQNEMLGPDSTLKSASRTHHADIADTECWAMVQFRHSITKMITCIQTIQQYKSLVAWMFVAAMEATLARCSVEGMCRA